MSHRGRGRPNTGTRAPLFLTLLLVTPLLLHAHIAAAIPPPVWPGTFTGPPHHPYGLVDGTQAGPVGVAGNRDHAPLDVLPNWSLGPFAPIASRLATPIIWRYVYRWKKLLPYVRRMY